MCMIEKGKAQEQDDDKLIQTNAINQEKESVKIFSFKTFSEGFSESFWALAF